MRVPFILAFFCLVSLELHAGPSSGNGGKGVLINGQTYLLDFVEGGIEEHPFFNENVNPDRKIIERVYSVFGNIADFPIEEVAQKLTEIYQQSAAIGILMLKTMELYSWSLVNLPPKPVKDQREGVQVEAANYVQAAKRLRTNIILGREAWKKMDRANRTGLIIHEIL